MIEELAKAFSILKESYSKKEKAIHIVFDEENYGPRWKDIASAVSNALIQCEKGHGHSLFMRDEYYVLAFAPCYPPAIEEASN